ncbi:MAG: TetR/AcrR family transcriptional regulator [Actinobacteria bacterium]|nr:TetR/AcrR family transcriptional regulator [Actinomycetota bacterium]
MPPGGSRPTGWPEIAESAGLGASSLYYWFRSKEQILERAGDVGGAVGGAATSPRSNLDRAGNAGRGVAPARTPAGHERLTRPRRWPRSHPARRRWPG